MVEIIHGDIKPHNVLIFDGEQGQHVAKVTDFGFSTIFNRDGLIMMPMSQPWNPPEHHHRGFTSIDAMKMDVYSFGLVCLWLLFFNSDKRDHKDFFTALEDQSNLQCFAYSLVTAEFEHPDILLEERTRLLEFFESALAKDPRQRSSSFQLLMQVLSSKE